MMDSQQSNETGKVLKLLDALKPVIEELADKTGDYDLADGSWNEYEEFEIHLAVKEINAFRTALAALSAPPTPAPQPEGDAKGIPTAMEREEDLRWLTMPSGEKADEFALDFFAIACKIGKKYITALEQAEAMWGIACEQRDVAIRRSDEAKAERDVLRAQLAEMKKQVGGDGELAAMIEGAITKWYEATASYRTDLSARELVAYRMGVELTDLIFVNMPAILAASSNAQRLKEVEGLLREIRQLRSNDYLGQRIDAFLSTAPREALPATICDRDEHRPCHDCGEDLAGKQAHFDEDGNSFCTSCTPTPRDESSGTSVTKE